MQAFPLTEDSPVYTPAMQTGRPAKTERTSFGQRLHALREQAGLSQQQLAERIGLSQRAYAYSERPPACHAASNKRSPPSSNPSLLITPDGNGKTQLFALGRWLILMISFS